MDAPLRGGALPRAGSRWGLPKTILLAVASFAALFGCLFPLRLPAQTSICAEVKIEIDQKVSLERQAFEAVLKIHNGLDGIPITAVEVNLAFLDENGTSDRLYADGRHDYL